MGKQSAGHRRKMIAPVIVTILFLIYLAAYVFFIVTAAGPKPVFILFAIPLIALGIGMVYTLGTRIKEIRSGEEDDLDNY